MQTLSHVEQHSLLPKVNECELIEEIKNGNEGAFEELARQYRPKILNHLRILCCDRNEAEDIFQDVMITLYKKIDTFEGRSSFSTWVYRITVNAFLMHKRKQKRQQLYFLGDEPFDAYLDPTVLHKEEELSSYYNILSNEFQLKLAKALSELPSGYRDVFLMHYKEDLAIKEISVRLGLSVSAVKSRHHRACQFLKERLGHNCSN